MSTLQLIVKELGHRKLNSSLSLLAVLMAVVLFVSFVTTGIAANRETRRIVRDIGYNLRIIPADTNMITFWNEGYSDKVMPVNYVDIFAQQEGISYTHLLPTLKQKIEWRSQEVILTGIAPEQTPPDKKVPSMVTVMEPDRISIGYEIASGLNIKRGDSVEIGGHSFTIDRTLAESGTNEDITIYAHLDDAQKILDMDGAINEINALECLCLAEGQSPLDILRTELQKLLPDTKVVRQKEIADARQKQRDMAEQYFYLIMPFVVVVCAVWIGALAMLNTRERRHEIGVLRALGYGGVKIISLFLGRAVLIGLAGAVAGFAIGTAAAIGFGPTVFKMTASKVGPEYILLGLSLLFAPTFSALACFIPATIAVSQDPADTLREE